MPSEREPEKFAEMRQELHILNKFMTHAVFKLKEIKDVLKFLRSLCPASNCWQRRGDVYTKTPTSKAISGLEKKFLEIRSLTNTAVARYRDTLDRLIDAKQSRDCDIRKEKAVEVHTKQKKEKHVRITTSTKKLAKRYRQRNRANRRVTVTAWSSDCIQCHFEPVPRLNRIELAEFITGSSQTFITDRLARSAYGSGDDELTLQMAKFFREKNEGRLTFASAFSVHRSEIPREREYDSLTADILVLRGHRDAIREKLVAIPEDDLKGTFLVELSKIRRQIKMTIQKRAKLQKKK